MENDFLQSVDPADLSNEEMSQAIDSFDNYLETIQGYMINEIKDAIGDKSPDSFLVSKNVEKITKKYAKETAFILNIVDKFERELVYRINNLERFGGTKEEESVEDFIEAQLRKTQSIRERTGLIEEDDQN